MKLSVRNLGPIGEGEVEIRPLTVFIGPNNSGKTYLAYALYGLLDWDGDEVLPKQFWSGFDDIQDTYIRPMAHAIAPGGDIAPLLRNLPAIYARRSKLLAQRWPKYLGLSASSRAGQHPDVKITSFGERSLRIRELARGPLESIFLAGLVDNPNLTEQIVGAPEQKPEAVVKEHLLSTLNSESIFRRARFFIPSMRNALTILADWVLWNQYKRVKSTAGRVDLGLPKPVEDYIGMTIESRRRLDFEVSDELRKVLQSVESRLFKGTVGYEANNGSAETSLHFRGQGAPSVPLTAASSGVQQLAWLYLYLTCWATKGDLIIIDEPEIHLHPSLQVGFVEVVASMVAAGLNVVLTTHTPYLVDHLNTLMLAKKVVDAKPTKRSTIARILESSDDEVDQILVDDSLVGAYLFDGGTIEDIHIAGEPIDWTSFGLVSDEMGEKYDAIQELT